MKISRVAEFEMKTVKQAQGIVTVRLVESIEGRGNQIAHESF